MEWSFDRAFTMIDEQLDVGGLKAQALADSFRQALNNENKLSDVRFYAALNVSTGENEIKLTITYSRDKVLRYAQLKNQKKYIEEQLKEFESTTEDKGVM